MMIFLRDFASVVEQGKGRKGVVGKESCLSSNTNHTVRVCLTLYVYEGRCTKHGLSFYARDAKLMLKWKTNLKKVECRRFESSVCAIIFLLN